MPGNGVEDRTRNLYELSNLSQGQHLPQAVGNHWQLINYNQLAGKSVNDKALPNFNFDNYVSEPLGSGKNQANFINAQLDPYYSPTEYSRVANQPGYFGESNCFNQQHLTSKGFHIPKQLQDNYCADSPTLTTNSERSEITEASCDFNFLGGNQNTLRNQSLDSPNYREMQQSGFNEMQLVQQNFIYRQLQEQRLQQLHQFSDNMQKNSFNQLAKQVPGVHFSPFANGMPVSDSPQILRSRMQLMEPAGAQGLLHRSMFPPDQSLPASQMNPAHQQLDVSLYGTPISDLRGSMPQFPYLQGMSHDSTNLLTKAGGQGGQAHKGTILSSEFGNLYTTDQSSELGVSEESFLAKQGFPLKGGDNQFHIQGLGSGVFTQNIQGNPPQDNDTSQPGFSGREDRAEWQTMQHTTKQAEVSQDLVPLDPLEAKILYNTDENIWDAFGDDGPGMISGGLDNTSEHRASSNVFTSIQSGGWSALMQSAVAEASNSDTGMHEEFSGLTFQDTENSNDNQKTSWVDNPSQNASHTPTPCAMVRDTSPSFPGFHQPGNGSSIELRNDFNQDASPQFFDNFNSQKKQSVEGSQKTQMFLHSGNTWPGQMTGNLQTNEQNQSVAPSTFLQADKGHESMGKIRHEINDGRYDPNETVNESYRKQNCYQRDGFITKGLRGHGQGHFEQFKFFGNNSSDIDVDKSHVPDIQADGRTPKEVHAGHQFNVRNQSRSTLTEVPGADHRMAFGSQLYMQAAASQGQGLNLAPPLQKPINSNSSFSPRSTMDGSNSTKANPELEERNKMGLTPSSFPLVPHESSREATWENTTGSAGNSGPSYWRAVTPHANTQNEAQIHAMSHKPVASQSIPVMSPGGGRHQNSSQVSSHNMFPVLETSTVPHPFNTSSVSRQHDITRSSHNQWESDHAQQQSCYAKPFRPSPQFPSWSEPPNRTMTTDMSVNLGPVADNSIKGEGESSEFPFHGSQGSGYGEHLEGVSQKQIPSVLPDGSQIDETTQNQDSGTTFTFQTVASQSPFQCLHRSPGQGMEITKDSSPSIFEPQHAPVLGGSRLDDNNSRCRSVGSATNSASPPNLFVSGETKMLSFNEDNGIGLASPQASLQATPSQEMVMFGHSTPNAQPSAVNSLSSGDHGPANLPMSPPWIKQYETLRNGQTVPLLDTRLAKAAFQHLSPGQPSQIPHTSLGRLDTGLSGRGWPSPSTTIVASHEPKKRKAAMSGFPPWHKEVTQESKRIRSLSMAEKLWARATNRRAEKVEDENEMIEEMQPVHRSKRRIILTSQLMQLLFLPAPSSVFSSEPTASNCETLVYLVSRLSLADSCSISCSKENSLLGPASGSITNVEEFSSVGTSSDLQRGEGLEVLVSRIKRLENDIQRLDKTASVVDLRTELRELEKFSVINRFAKFHARGPSDGPQRLFLQRYVTAFPLPRNLPEGVQCFSL